MTITETTPKTIPLVHTNQREIDTVSPSHASLMLDHCNRQLTRAEEMARALRDFADAPGDVILTSYSSIVGGKKFSPQICLHTGNDMEADARESAEFEPTFQGAILLSPDGTWRRVSFDGR